MLFSIDAPAAEYILDNGGAVVIELKFQESAGDILPAGRHLLGSYAPVIRLGEPEETGQRYERTWLEGTLLYHVSGVRPKPGCPAIRIVGRTLLCFRWLELEVAKHTPVFEE